MQSGYQETNAYAAVGTTFFTFYPRLLQAFTMLSMLLATFPFGLGLSSFRSESIQKREKNCVDFQVQFKLRVFIFYAKQDGGMNDPLVGLRKQRPAKDFTPQ